MRPRRKRMKLSKKTVTVKIGKTVKLKLKNNKKKVKWTVNFRQEKCDTE